MNVALKGSSPATMTCGILLLAKARSFGQRIHVEIVGDPTDIGVVTGPAILHSAPLASCGVGRELGSGALVVVPGPAELPVALSLSADGRSDWFLVDRAGTGVHPATQAFVRLRRDPRPEARVVSRRLLGAMAALGCAAETGVLDLLFGAPAPPLTRLAVALRAGRTLSGARGLPITAAIQGELDDDAAVSVELAFARLAAPVRAGAIEVREGLEALGGYEPLIDALKELILHLGLLPVGAILPPLDPAADAVAFGLGRGLAASRGNVQAQLGLLETYRFLGGTFTPSATYPVELPSDLPPDERLARWKWFCSHVSEAAARVEKIWRDLVDPPM
jgi:hypothetical protein